MCLRQKLPSCVCLSSLRYTNRLFFWVVSGICWFHGEAAITYFGKRISKKHILMIKRGTPLTKNDCCSSSQQPIFLRHTHFSMRISSYCRVNTQNLQKKTILVNTTVSGSFINRTTAIKKTKDISLFSEYWKTVDT